MRIELLSGSGGNADPELSGVAEPGETAEPYEDFRGHEAQLGGSRSIATADDDDRAFHVADFAIVGERAGQHGSELCGPIFLVGCMPQ